MNQYDREVLDSNDKDLMRIYAQTKWTYLLTDQQKRDHRKIVHEKAFWQMALGISLMLFSICGLYIEILGFALLPGFIYSMMGMALFDPMARPSDAEIIAINDDDIV